MTRELIRAVWKRADGRCEYCLIPVAAYPLPFQIDHVVARKHGGKTTSTNLALACCHCNAHKGPNIAGIDVQSGEMVRLYHPRKDKWATHFKFVGAELVGLSAVGRVTIQVLAMNDPDFRAVRESLAEEGLI